MPEGRCVATTSVGATCGRPWSSWRQSDQPALEFRGRPQVAPTQRAFFFPSETRTWCRNSLQFFLRQLQKGTKPSGTKFAHLPISKESSCEGSLSFSSSWCSRSAAC
jgi:hypothetical protein